MLSPSKILLIILVFAAVYVASRFFRGSGGGDSQKMAKKGESSPRSSGDTVELVECPRCGAFVSDLSKHDCNG